MQQTPLIDAVKSIIRKYFDKYDSTMSGTLNENDKKKMKSEFGKDFSTYQNMEQEFLRSFGKGLEIIQHFAIFNDAPLIGKGLKLNVNHSNEEKSYLEVSYKFESPEKKKSMMNSIHSGLGDLADKFCVALKLGTQEPELLKQKVSMLINLCLQMAESFAPDDVVHNVISSLKIDYQTGANYLIVSIYSTFEHVNFADEMMKAIAQYLSKFTLDFDISLKIKNALDEFVKQPNKKILDFLSDGLSLNFSSSTNWVVAIIQEIMPKSKGLEDKLIGGLISFLDVGLDLSVEKGNFEKQIFWNIVPDKEFVESNNPIANGIFMPLKQMKQGFPMSEQIWEIVTMLNSKIEVTVNTPCGMLDVKVGTEGTLTVWEKFESIIQQT